MKNQKSFSLAGLFVLLALILIPGAILAEDKGPKAAVQGTVDEIVAVVSTHQGDDETVLHGKLREIITPYFDFQEMAKRALGKHWLDRTPEERTEYVDAFSEVLARTYLNRIDDIEEDTVSIQKERVLTKTAIVKTLINYKGDSFPIDYKLTRKAEGEAWRVYDVVIENIGLISNYRKEFAGIIRKEGFEGLMEGLREKNLKAVS